jgi:hypothetical protein
MAAQYRIMVPKTAVAAPEGVAYERVAPQYAPPRQMVSSDRRASIRTEIYLDEGA